MHPLFEQWVRLETRRQFFARGMNAVGAAALASLMANGRSNAETIAKEMKEANITVFAIVIGMPRIQDEIHTITETTGGEAFEKLVLP